MKKSIHFFALDQSFLDPTLSKDGSAYGPKRYKEIVQECWFISDQLHTSYTDVLDLAFQDRMYLIECIKNKNEDTKKAIDEIKTQSQQKK